ncbi:hypothetical protein SERLA73DRAFT_116652 [Serpula lacrymans var. lacrymans S7.3]|uniref:MYND-type domain-containing protein n=3 Tax=Serpula lacrymans var. lacrymans TaxID=341189 RepID=F8QFK7_SERL3|nr:uncharacterized protein SERLADRAFT_445456 [Serpula lacrymans var. lacrymans S7.9]EGN92841.1 hypothetical protein SERLA73DRAFT_116652 [Serpula lacrymans var. lacrymans S7.3]EGO29671.1 hypothetical protein SERLADRAFT_445456 [Serpula lacrymans var. lacrymans S7.9]
MSHPLVWPGKYFFYAIGNTSAVCLSRDLPPDEPGNLLLLGCGDPRNVLFTIFCEPPSFGRKLDFTCCDIDPAILARNVLLFTMIADKHSNSTIWNIFFHFYVDKDTHSTLIEHCKKLIGLSDTLKNWNSSIYGPHIKMCTEYTLAEIRRHWSLYVELENLPSTRIKAIRNAFTNQYKATMFGSALSTARSSGPLLIKAAHVMSDQIKNYWKTGTTFTNSKELAAATLLNPTFVYSLAGERFSVHYGTDPMTPFHLAALFGNTRGPVSMVDVVKAAKAEFNDWCSAYSVSLSSSSRPTIRFIVGDVTRVCRALQGFALTGTLKMGLPVAQWKTQLINLNGDEYLSGGAPTSFNVIDTSNLDDHVGLLNVLVASIPLLSPSSSSVLYAESLLFHGLDGTKEFAEHLYADLTAVGLLLGLCPVDYLSGFTTRSNTHEVTLYRQLTKEKRDVPQYHQVTTWKAPASGDTIAAPHIANIQPPVFDPRQLGTLLYDIYHELFEQEDAMHFWRLNQGNLAKAVGSSNLVHYIRESFVLLLRLVRDRLSVSEETWLEIMDRFFDLEHADQTLPMDTLNYQDLCGLLYRHGVFTMPIYHMKASKLGRVSHWDTVTPIVRIVLVIPREKLAVLEHSTDEIGTPPLQADVIGNWCQNTFTAIHVAFGRAISMGTKANPRVVFEEDTKGWSGTSSLVVSFTMPTMLLTDKEPPENLNVDLTVRSTPATLTLINKLGIRLTVFSAKLMDESLVHVLPEYPLPSKKPQASPSPPAPAIKGLLSQIGELSAAVVELDEQCELVASLTCRVSVSDIESKRLFQSGAAPQVAQVSPCVMRITLGSREQDVIFPFPVSGSANKLRLARKSLYIEVVVPASRTLKPDGMKINPFPVIDAGGIFNSWSIHRINLPRLPVLDIKGPKIGQWLNPHVGSMLSSRERSNRKKHRSDALMFVKDTLHAIFVGYAGIQSEPPRRLFALQDEATNNCDTIFFISELRYDLASHTVICDGYVLPLTRALLIKIEKPFAKLVFEGNMGNVPVFEGEMQTWKQLIPAFVERCRSWSHGENCEYKAQGKIPLTEDMEKNPLCSCGRGKDVEGMNKVNMWKPLAPYVTRIALSPLFAVSYLETVGRDPEAYRCFVCRGKGKPKLKMCTVCKKVRYCSSECQKKDWKVHKLRCKA